MSLYAQIHSTNNDVLAAASRSVRLHDAVFNLSNEISYDRQVWDAVARVTNETWIARIREHMLRRRVFECPPSLP